MRKLLILVPVFALVVATAISVSASISNVRIIGADQFIPNRVIKADYHFSPGPISVESGDSVTWNNGTDDEHTITLVEESQVPEDFEGVLECRDPAGVCRAALDVHFGTDPPTDVIEAGAAGLDTPGDSLLVEEGGTVTAVISAPSGTDLYYICSVHPWMQGEIEVE